ncbi:hypothetical protein JHK87_047955 [Glycine soja]|nr:hypothetical protein JHK87_047955 [Glycine soja]
MTLCFMPVELGLQLLSIILVSMLLVLPASVHFDLCFDTRSLYFAHSCQHSISLHFDVPSLSFILFLCSECSRFKVAQRCFELVFSKIDRFLTCIEVSQNPSGFCELGNDYPHSNSSLAAFGLGKPRWSQLSRSQGFLKISYLFGYPFEKRSLGFSLKLLELHGFPLILAENWCHYCRWNSTRVVFFYVFLLHLDSKGFPVNIVEYVGSNIRGLRQRMIFLSWFGRTIRFRARVSPVELEGAPLARVCHLTDYHLTVLRLGIKIFTLLDKKVMAIWHLGILRKLMKNNGMFSRVLQLNRWRLPDLKLVAPDVSYGKITYILSSSSDFSNAKVQKCDPPMNRNGSSSTIMNFSHFARLVAMVRANLQSIGLKSSLSSSRSDSMEMKNKGAVATSRIPPESIHVDSSGECLKEPTMQCQQVVEQSKVDVNTLQPKSIEQNVVPSKQSEPAGKESSTKIDLFPNQVLGDSGTKGQTAAEKSKEPIVASSSVCSGNGTYQDSEEQKSNFEAKKKRH